MFVNNEHIYGNIQVDFHSMRLTTWRKKETAIIIFSYLASLVVKPNQGMIPGQHLAVEGGVVLGRATPSHRPADLDWLIQVHMPLLEWVRVGSAGEHSQR